MRALWFPVALLIALSGCTSCGLPDLLSGVPARAPAEGGLGEHALTIHVTDVYGEGAAAGVIIAWIKNEQADGDLPHNLDLWALHLRSSNGTVVAHVPGDKSLAVIVYPEDTSAFNMDWKFDLPAGTNEVTIPLAPHFVAAYHNMTLAPLQDGGMISGGDRLVTSLWHDDPVVNERLARRLVALQATLEWENTPTSMADLGIMVVAGDDRRVADATDPGLGSKSESVDWDAGTMIDYGFWHDAGLAAGITTDTGIVGLEPIEATFWLKGSFGVRDLTGFVCSTYEGHEAEFTKAPVSAPAEVEDADIAGIGVLAAMLAVVGAVALCRRR